jgi:acetyl-CoA carboxylase biotin carboxyl carrier protein
MTTPEHEHDLEASVDRLADGVIHLRAPALGLWCGAPRPGTPLIPGMQIGTLSILGARHPLRVPAGVAGVVQPDEEAASSARHRPVEYDQRLLILDATAVDLRATEITMTSNTVDGRLVFRAPTSGRYYQRPAPDRAPFVAPGMIIERGHAIGLLEVMKTFNRVHYDGAGLPETARVLTVFPADGDDVAAGDPLIEVQAQAQDQSRNK